jgi:RimJ/RimL family protein N-acetyltransferase
VTFSLETERLVMRPKTLDDLPFMHRLLSDPAVMRYVGDGRPRSLETVREGLLMHLEHQRRYGFSLWLVSERGGAEPIGDCGIMPLDGGPEIEVGYRFVPSVWGRGYATEAAAAALRYGFDVAGLDEIVAVAYPGNTASRRVMEKIGMTYDGRGIYYGNDSVRYVIRRTSAEPIEVVDYDPKAGGPRPDPT